MSQSRPAKLLDSIGEPTLQRTDGPPTSEHADGPIVSDRSNDDVSLLNIDLTSDDFVDHVIADADRDLHRPNAERRVTDAKQVDANVPHRRKQLVLVGAGQVHLLIVNDWLRHLIPGVDLILVSAFDRVAYREMLPGTVAGLYPPEEMLVDLPKLCARRGVRLIVDRATSLDPVKREIQFAHQPTLRFDLASINIGTVPEAEELWQSHRIMIGTKPLASFLARFLSRFDELVEQWKTAPSADRLQVVVVGGGAAGVEMAFCLEQRRYDLELPIDVRIVDGHFEILHEFPKSVIRKVKKLFHERGIETSLGSRVVDCDDVGPSSLILGNGTRIRADLVIWATGTVPPKSVDGFQLPKSPQGFLKIRPTFQVTAEVPVFAVGDIAELTGQPKTKLDGDAIRQARILHQNLRNWFIACPLVQYHPRDSAQTILTCGDGTAVLNFKRLCFHGRWVWSLKNRLNRQWIRGFQ